MSENLEELNLEELKEEATSLGLIFSKTIGAAKLKEKIDGHYEAHETSGPAVLAAVEKNEKAEAFTQKGKVGSTRQERARIKHKEAVKTRVITVIDNDQRVNNHTNTCTVSCSNEFYDLGTKLLPLNEKIEVCQGHINVLKSVQIPLHVKDNKTGLSSVRMRPRYSISYENA